LEVAGASANNGNGKSMIGNSRVMLLALAGLLTSACDQVSDQVSGAVEEQAAIARAKESVVRQQPDPEAAQFRDVVQVGDMVCGDLNSKNLLGAYAGFKPFIYREFANGLAAWQTTGLSQLGLESRSVDGCLFPQANQCDRELQLSTCHKSDLERHLANGYPRDQLGADEPDFYDFGNSNTSRTEAPDQIEKAVENDRDDPPGRALVGPPVVRANNAPPTSIDQLKLDWSRFDFKCRNGDDPIEQQVSCADREATETELAFEGLCRTGEQWNAC